jgi:hypothetical protein
MDSGTEIRETVQLLEDAVDASRRGSWLSAKLLTDNASRRIERIRLAKIASTPYRGENLLDYVRMGFMIVGIVLVGIGWFAAFCVQVFALVFGFIALVFSIPTLTYHYVLTSSYPLLSWPAALLTSALGICVICVGKYVFDRVWAREDWLPVRALQAFWSVY